MWRHTTGRLVQKLALWRSLCTVVAEIPLPHATKWPEKSCDIVVALPFPVERVRKQSSAGVVAQWPGLCLLERESLDWYWSKNCLTTLRDTLRHLASSVCNKPLSIHQTAHYLNESKERLVLDLARFCWLVSMKLHATNENQQILHTKLRKIAHCNFFSYSLYLFFYTK